MKLLAWIVGVYLKITGQWIGLNDYRSMKADVCRLARVFHLDHHAVILDEDNGRACSECVTMFV